MQKGFIYILFALFCFAFLTSSNTVYAYEFVPEVEYSLASESDCEGILGRVTDHDSFAYMLQQIFTIIGYLGPILCLVLSIMDFLKAAASQDKDNLNKAFKKTGKRIVLAIAIFFLPMLINFLFPLLGWYGGTCGIE